MGVHAWTPPAVGLIKLNWIPLFSCTVVWWLGLIATKEHVHGLCVGLCMAQLSYRPRPNFRPRSIQHIPARKSWKPKEVDPWGKGVGCLCLVNVQLQSCPGRCHTVQGEAQEDSGSLGCLNLISLLHRSPQPSFHQWPVTWPHVYVSVSK